MMKQTTNVFLGNHAEAARAVAISLKIIYESVA